MSSSIQNAMDQMLSLAKSQQDDKFLVLSGQVAELAWRCDDLASISLQAEIQCVSKQLSDLSCKTDLRAPKDPLQSDASKVYSASRCF